LCLLTLLFGCDRPEDDAGEPADGFAERSATRRLTVEEWQNTVVDLLGIEVDPSLLPADELTAGFPANVSASLSDLEVEATLAAAESAAAAATSDVELFLGCDPAERACVEAWAGPFLERAWRRPIEADERTSFLALTELGGTPADGVRLAVTGALVSGSFLYRPEVGGTPAGGRVALDGWQVASRLSYLLWRTMPDEILFEAARTEALSSPEQIEEQALRLLADPRGAEALASFHVDWLGLGSLPLLDRVPTPPPPQPLQSHPLLDLDAGLWDQTDAQGLTLPAGTFADGVLDTGAPAISSDTSDTEIYAHHGVELGSTFMLRGSLGADDPDASLGVTFLSGLPASNAWYRLERRPGEIYALESAGTDGACAAESTLSLDVTASIDFEIEVEATFSAVTIEARVWATGAPRPNLPQLVCVDDSFTRLTDGTVGVWSSGPGIKAWGDLLLQTSVPEEPFDFQPVAAAFVDGARSFLETWAADGARLDELLLADWAMANQTLAPYLGVEGVTGESWQRVTLPPERIGLLTQPLFLSVFAKPDQSSPILRGKAVREMLLCDVLLPPPPGVVTIAPDLDPSLTTRERFAEHVADPSCAACHQMIDPIGFGFEAFDQLGVYREFENGNLPVDASGEIVSGGDADGTFVDVRGLVEQLASSDEVRSCIVTHWYRYAAAHLEDPEAGDPALTAALDACTDETCRVEDIVRAIVTSDSFRFRAAHDGDTP
jgi:hypothetical protein